MLGGAVVLPFLWDAHGSSRFWKNGGFSPGQMVTHSPPEMAPAGPPGAPLRCWQGEHLSCTVPTPRNSSRTAGSAAEGPTMTHSRRPRAPRAVPRGRPRQAAEAVSSIQERC